MEELDTASMPPRGDECACILCGAPFPMEEDNEDLRSHLASDHLNYRPVRCSICAVGFTLQSAFERHVDVVHRKYRDTWNAHPTTNHDEVLEATLESLVRLSLQQNWSGLNASTNLLVAAEDEYVNCGLCPDDAEVFPSSKSREDHVRTHVNKMRTVTKTAPMIGSKRTLRRRRSALHSFYVEYAKCFPDRLHADLLEEPPQAQKRPVGRRKKPAKWKLLAESLPTSSSPSEILPAEQQPSTAEREESGVRAATKSKRHRSLPKRFSEQSFYLPPSIDTSNTSSISNAVNVCYAPNTWGAWKPPKAQVK
uniref:C2H2-type domain-containing protein n=1 Tax=Plectus sambesii TaxID=2011161 RepID=A0A914UNV7_9BILA